MADGDEKIDHNDRVYVLNRVTDDKVDIMFDGKTLSWKPGEVKSIQRMQAFDHYVRKSLIRADPTGETFPIEALVAIDDDRQPLETGAAVTPLTKAEVAELRKFGVIDTTKLPPDRLVGGQLLMDPETGEYPSGLALRGAPKGGEAIPPLVRPLNRGQIDQELDQVDA